MMLELRYGWRNLLRSRGRTALTLAAVSLAVGLLVVGSSLITGIGDGIIGDIVRQNGHVRLTAPGFLARQRFRPLSYTITDVDSRIEAMRAAPGVAVVAPRLSFGGLVQFVDKSMVVPRSQIVDESTLSDEQLFGKTAVEPMLARGVDPGAELVLGEISRRLVEGGMFDAESAQGKRVPLVVGLELAKRLGLRAGAQVELVASHRGLSAAPAVVVGVHDTGNRTANRQCYLPLEAAQKLLDLPDRATEILVMAHDLDSAEDVASELAALPEASSLERRVYSDEPFLRTVLVLVGFMMSILLGFLVAMAGTGLLNAMLSAVMERRVEIGTLLALGLGRSRVVGTVLAEAAFTAGLASVVGGALGAGLSMWLGQVGIEIGADAVRELPMAIGSRTYPRLTAEALGFAVALGFVVCLLGALVPAWRASRFQPVDAMRR
jgi:putative ABC transport system permease protein